MGGELDRYGLRVLVFYLRDLDQRYEELVTSGLSAASAGGTTRSGVVERGLKWYSVNITDFLSTLRWSESIAYPYGTILATIRQDLFNQPGLGGLLNNRTLPAWISVQSRDATTGHYVTLQTGIVNSWNVRTSIGPDGDMNEIGTLQAVSYLDLCHLFTLNVCTVKGTAIDQKKLARLLDGTFFSVADWVRKAGSIVKVLPSKDVGEALKLTWEHFARVYVPVGAFNGSRASDARMLSTLVHINFSNKLHDDNKVRGERGTYPYKGFWNNPTVPGFNVQALSNVMSFGGTFGGMLQGSFVPDPGLVEMFPVLANNKAHLIYRMAPFRVLKSSAYRNFLFNQGNEAFIRTRDGRVGSDGSVTGGAGPEVLGTEHGTEFTEADADEYFGDPTWSPAQACHIHKGDFKSTDLTFASPGRTANVVTASWPFMPQALSFIGGQIGLPLVDDASLLTMGARVYKPSWPFLPNLDTKSRNNSDWKAMMRSFSKFIKAVALEAAQFRMNLDYMGLLNITAVYSPQVRIGRPLAIYSTPSQLPADQGGGLVVGGVDAGGSKPSYAYTTRVTHTINIEGGRFTAESTIETDRYLNAALEHLRYNPVASDTALRLRFPEGI